jgi:hypothetical protein
LLTDVNQLVEAIPGNHKQNPTKFEMKNSKRLTKIMKILQRLATILYKKSPFFLSGEPNVDEVLEAIAGAEETKKIGKRNAAMKNDKKAQKQAGTLNFVKKNIE